MKIGIIGSGHIGGNLGIHLANAGHSILFSSRHPEQLKDLANEAGKNATTGTIEQAADFGDVLVLSIPFWAVEEAAKKVGPLEGKIIIETANPYPGRDGEVATKAKESDRPASTYVSGHFPKAHVVKAFNTIYYEHLKNQASRAGDRRAIPYAGDDKKALELVEELITQIGFAPVYVGKLSESHLMDVDQPLYNKDLTEDETKQIIRDNRLE